MSENVMNRAEKFAAITEQAAEQVATKVEKMTELSDEFIAAQVEKWVAIGLSTRELSPAEYRRATNFVYKMLGETPPAFEVFKSCSEAWERVRSFCATNPEEYAELEEPIYPTVIGNCDAGFLAAIDTLQHVTDLEEDVLEYLCLAGLGYIWPLEGLCVYCEPPIIKIDENGELHCEDGPAANFNDKDLRWFLHGIEVDEQIVLHPETQTVAQIMSEDNADKQAIRAARYGWLRLLGEIDAKVLDERPNDIEGTYETLFETTMGHKFVPTCVTGEIPVLTVPREILTCEAAMRWIHRDEKINIVART